MIPAESIWVVIPVHGRIEYTVECLNSLRRQTAQGFRIVVVDDGSLDNTQGTIRADFPEVELLVADGSLWWSGAMNLGVTHALANSAAYLVSLNNDALLATNFLEGMMKWASHRPEALFGALIYDADTRNVVYAGERIRWLTAGNQFLANRLSEEQTGIQEVTHCPGRGLWIPAITFQRIGFFDAVAMPQSMADYDFTMRAKRSGYELYCNYDAVVYSTGDLMVGGGRRESVGGLELLQFRLSSIRSGANLRGRWILASRHAPWYALFPYMIASVFRILLGTIGEWIRGSDSHRKSR